MNREFPRRSTPLADDLFDLGEPTDLPAGSRAPVRPSAPAQSMPAAGRAVSVEGLKCPACGTSIEISQALAGQIGAEVRAELEREFARKSAALETEAERVRARAAELKQAEALLEQRVAAEVQRRREPLEQELRRKWQEEVAVELRDRDRQAAELRARLKTAEQAELELRARERRLLEEKEKLELAVARRLTEEREAIRSAAKREAADEFALRLAEKDKQIGDLGRTAAELKAQLERGPQQIAGEVQELAVERMLRDLFPDDQVLPVPKGVHGGDVIQRVLERGRECGVVLWESKRTRRWSDGWTAKTRDDQRAAGAAHAVIVTETMPEGCDTFTHCDGVWITTRRCAPGVAAAVRSALVAVADAQRAVAGRHEKTDALYRYLIGPEFRNRVSGIAEAFVEMLGDLEAERRATQRLWAKREKQIRRAAINTSAFYGDIQGVLGSEVAAIEKLELPALPEQQAEG